MHYYEVAPTIIVRADQNSFTYGSQAKLSVGDLVEISLGKKNVIGLVTEQTSKPKYDVKLINRRLDLPPLPKSLVETASWMSNYYATALATVLQTILPRGLDKTRRANYKPPRLAKNIQTNYVFTNDQLNAIETIDKMPQGTALLHGVTGSGKTAVYIELAKKTIEAGKSVIVLVPEIALTSQIVNSFFNHFPDLILTHSKQTEAQRHLAWLEALNSRKPRLVIGPRSALFTPLAGIGLVVIDESHEPSFKQDQSPRYQAGRVAAALAKLCNAKIILGSATPSISDYYLADKLNRPIVEMPKPARLDTSKPEIMLIDMTKRDNFTKHRFLSDAMLVTVDKTLASKQQVLIFHNRRGTASSTLCEKCGWQAGCTRCFVPLTLHADNHQLICHICGFNSRVPTSCPECSHADIIHKGIGTKLVESELKRLYPKANIVRFDGDSADGDSVHERYDEIYDGSIDIVIGTQVVAKGLDLPNLRAVGVIQADAGLALPDFGATERSFQLLHQVIGRVGRSHHPTKVIVQSYQPTHPAVQDGISQNYKDFYHRTLSLRNRTGFPPYRYLLQLTCIYKTEKAAISNTKQMASIIRQKYPGIELLGPTPAFYERTRDSYRWQLVVKSTNRQMLLDVIKLIPKTHWQIDIDPYSLL